MSNITGTSKIDPGVNNYYDKLLLARSMPYLIHMKGAQQRNLPAKMSDTMKFRRYSNLSLAKTPLTEGVTPAGQTLSKVDMTVQLDQYGDYIVLTDKVQYVVEDEVLNETSDLLAQQMGETLDELTRDALNSTASVTYCQYGTNGDATATELTFQDIQGVVKGLMGQSAKMFTNIVSASNKFATAPVRASYIALSHTDLLDDLEDVDGFTSVANYSNDKGLDESEWGSVGNTRWFLSPLGYELGGYYSSFICGKEAYGISKLNELSVENVFKPLGHGDDYLNQRSSMGWKSCFAARVLNDNFMTKLVSSHS